MTEKHKFESDAANVRDPVCERALGLLGLAARAGMLIYGTENILNVIRAGGINPRGSIVVIALDTSERTKKELRRVSDEEGITYAELGVSMLELGYRTGSKGSAAAVAVKDKNLASALKKLI